MPFQHKRGTTSSHSDYIGEPGEITVDTEKNVIVVHDGTTSGGHPHALESTASVTIVDDFESGVISNYGGDTAEVSTQTSTVYEGSYALTNDTAVTGTIASTSGLNAYPSQGDTFAWRTQIGSGFAGALFAVQGESGDSNVSGYLVHADSAAINIQRADSGSYTKLSETTATIPTGEWLEFEVSWDSSGNIDVTLYDGGGSQVATVSATDTNYTSGGIGWRTDSTDQYHDYYVIK